MGQCSSNNSTDVRTNMTSKDYDQLEMLNGHWIFDRDENLEAFFKAAGTIAKTCPSNTQRLFSFKN